MKVYVDELPKSPNDCIFQAFIAYHKNGWEHHERYCLMKNELTCNCSKENCPLQSLADYTKQVRKEVVDEIRDLAGDYWTVPLKKYLDYDGNEIKAVITMKDFDEILDQVQGE